MTKYEEGQSMIQELHEIVDEVIDFLTDAQSELRQHEFKSLMMNFLNAIRAGQSHKLINETLQEAKEVEGEVC